MIKSHAELEAEHYRAVRDNPEYRLDGMMDVRLEEMSYYLPYRDAHSTSSGQAPECPNRASEAERQVEKPVVFYDQFLALQAHVRFLENKVRELQERRDKNDGIVTKRDSL